ncbi:lipocalin family protein [uncultured Aquimarina sp.]|uniref:lipocalin family protein n=1 Tax=uncultured Aquimarina sp. TaxID=575652 RepID=UPI0026258A0A|nr:lipocalin family protein [uncultured Aquimarina sp.]
MKKLNLFLTLLLTITLFSCGSDDDGTTETFEITEANLIGAWKLISVTENGTAIQLDECDLLYSVQLSVEQGENRAVYTEAGLEGNSCTIFTSTDYTWSLTSDNILNTETLEGSDQDSEKIIELTAITLKLEYIDTEGSDTFITVDTYTKQ